MDAVPPPVPHDATPLTEAMSVAVKHLAEQQIIDEGAAATHTSTRTVNVLGLRRW